MKFIFTLCTEIFWLFGFTLFILLSPMESFLGVSGIMYFFAATTLASGFFVMFYFPETKGKSNKEIAELLAH